MQRHRRHSRQTIAVMHALALDPSRWRYGYDLGVELGLKSGSLYPILIRLADRGLLASTWEHTEPGKPPRHLYRLTNAGAAEAARARCEPSPTRTPYAELGPA
jgi:PadR family transcriptional regulator, regulatory protein PadR